ncbi:cytochrome c biogenesis protein CcsA [Puniceicoccales bacterium CK1056]|uniref:Cytochrome c biogenesis protein CcsA n=1 Tax=Oceanipulchritudo coccoides TaxID=2706888 RepID=A0A6B2M480_9BACT|nr:cytochrome c biogenesis protein CcsA [Oceanipulchritudo coccoides]NDV63102.1 cytochrome c biogenesis protein CcsA [Oceanipulchritudo coccoides]
MKRVFPVIFWLIALSLVWPVFKPLVRKADSPEASLGQMSVLEGGRVKPLDSVARSTLLLFRGKQSIRTESGKVTATEWFTDLLLNRDAVADMPVFRIDHPNILGMFGLEAGTKKYFSYAELEPYLSRIQEQARQVSENSDLRGPYEKAINQLFGNLMQYQLLSQTVYPLRLRDSLPVFYNAVAGSILESRMLMGGDSPVIPDPAKSRLMRIHMQQLDFMGRTPLFLLFHDGDWIKPSELLQSAVGEAGVLPDQLTALASAADARQNGDESAFAEAVAQLTSFGPDQVDANPGVEYYFNQSQPFIVSLGLYVFVALLVFLGWQFSMSLFLPSAYGILLLGLVIHTVGLILRVIITGYAPVTNLYSSAVFTGWVAVLLSVGFEYFQRKGVGSLAAATVGFLTLLVAHHLSDSGDTMEKMRAVLNSNFWLSTHVITIVMGYGATFLAGFLGLIYILYGWFRRGLDKEMQKSFHRMIFGAICFSLLFSFIGTVLGGIWADQSWGRFWGWDPKENGALMLVLWTTMIIHGLRCGMFKTRGLVNLAIGGNMITAWSWFGTNMLGVGLHSYGFMDSAFFWLVIFWLSQLLFIGVEWLIPVRVKKI